MEEKRKSSPTVNWPSAVLLLAVAGNILWLQSPLTSSRPAETPRFHGAVLGDQAVDSRMWQDPFDAVNLYIKAGRASDTLAKIGDVLSSQITRHCDGSTDVLLMPVMVTGSQYTEGSEWRVRMRFAILSGLQRSGFVSEDSDHIGFVKIAWPPGAVLATKVPLASVSLPNPDTNTQLKLTIPFEWLERYDSSKTNPPKDHVLLLWLHEEMFSDYPLTRLALLVQNLRAANSSTNKSLPVKVIGPFGSTTLREMFREETTNFITWSSNTAKVHDALTDMVIYSPSATAADWRIIGGNADNRTNGFRHEIVSNFTSKGVSLGFVNVTCTDDQLAKELVDELLRRGVDLTNAFPRIALISEWDTFYGRALPQSFTNAVARLPGNGPSNSTNCVWRYTYLRGLDGKLAGREDSSGSKPDSSSTDKTGNKSLAIEQLERPEGNSQLDYIPRLAAALKARELESIREHREGGSLRAIGLLGSDVYDKLLLLQSLRRRFPDVIFFTTDLDARLSHASQIRWSRNLIVSSSFGLALKKEFQGGIPPFRDTYQTADFLATQVALDTYTNALTNALSPRLFEIGRYGPYDLSVATNIVPLHPPRVNELFGLKPWRSGGLWWIIVKWTLFTGLTLGLLVVLSWKICEAANKLCTNWKIIRLRLFMASVLLSFGAWLMINNHFSSDGEPFSILAGISIWPTELIRLAATILGVVFIRRAGRELNVNAKELRREFGSELFCPESPSENNTDNPQEKLSLQERFREICIRWRMMDREGSTAQVGGDIKAILKTYAYLGQMKYRVMRCSAIGACYFVFAIFLFIALGIPFVPGRGNTSFLFDKVAVMSTVIALIAVTFFVMDATRLCTQLIRKLSQNRITWLEGQPEVKDETWGLSGDELNEWTTIRFIARRTKSVGKMIYYPFAVLFLLIISRNSFFDAWTWPASLVVIQGLNVSFALFSALHLRREAEHARRRALGRLNESLSKELGTVKDKTAPNRTEQIRLVIRLIENNEEGAFAPLSNQPIIGALAMPFGGASIMAGVEYLATH